ncbi:MAG: ImmA/IrrE family metallo-endopeptidase [Oscillospiraceae bacterium]|nr:ImmA/IrrE family metallo-endopeptidase [Oscillospiraceae bacterium]
MTNSYNKIITKARELLVSQDDSAFKTFKLDLTKLNYSGKNVLFDTFQNYAKITGTKAITKKQNPDGCTIVVRELNHDTNYVILTHEILPMARIHRSNARNVSQKIDIAKRRLKWTLAHEIGHMCLGHTKDNPAEEREANAFASELLMPELVLLELNRQLPQKLTIYELVRIFGVSQSAAENRLTQLQRKTEFSPALKEPLMAKYNKLVLEYVDKAKQERVPQRWLYQPRRD